MDKKAFLNFRENHPRPDLNYRGEPQWDGSDAQRLLKEDMTAGKHLKYDTPSEFRDSRPEYQTYNKKVFRGHIHQEVRLRKLYNLIEEKREEKKEEHKKQLEKQRAQHQRRVAAARAEAERKAELARARAALNNQQSRKK